ncbi:unnamed protein product, partial [Meganyctiphanes norvegica]
DPGGSRRRSGTRQNRFMLVLLLLSLSLLPHSLGNNAIYDEQPITGDVGLSSGRKRGYMALDSYANEVTEAYCPPAPPTKSKFSVFGFLSMMVSLSMTVANVINAINNNNNNNNDNNNNDNNNNSNGANADDGVGGGGDDGAGDDPQGTQSNVNIVPVRVNQVSQGNANADLNSEGVPVQTTGLVEEPNANTISFAGRKVSPSNYKLEKLNGRTCQCGKAKRSVTKTDRQQNLKNDQVFFKCIEKLACHQKLEFQHTGGFESLTGKISWIATSLLGKKIRSIFDINEHYSINDKCMDLECPIP